MSIESKKPAPVPMLDVGRGNQPLKHEILAALERVIDSGRFLHGPEVTELEKTVAQVCGTSHAIGCASGSDALLLALMALDLEPGDEVIVPSFIVRSHESELALFSAISILLPLISTSIELNRW